MADKTWRDRVRDGAYTSPDGERIRFQFEDVSRVTPLRTSVFSFAGVNNDYVQQNGFGSRTYPLRCYFSGPQCDLLASAFEVALLKPGIGKLEHPLYGDVRVVPVGDITRNDALRSAANQAVVEATFWTTTGAVYPNAETDALDEIYAAIASFDYLSAQQFANSVTLSRPTHRGSLTGGIRKMLGGISGALSGISAGVTSINKEFREIQSTINYGLDVLIGQPLLLAQQVQNLIKAPARALSGIQQRLDSYGQLSDSIFNSREGNPVRELTGVATSSQRQGEIANNFHLSSLVAATAIAAGALAAASAAAFKTKPEALRAADTLANQFNEFVVWRDAGFSALGDLDDVAGYLVDTGETYAALQRLIALTLGNLITTSFSLLPERAVILDRPRTIIDLCAELYPNSNIDDKLDFLIDTNDLSGDEILELQRGRRIVYYAA